MIIELKQCMLIIVIKIYNISTTTDLPRTPSARYYEYNMGNKWFDTIIYIHTQYIFVFILLGYYRGIKIGKI